MRPQLVQTGTNCPAICSFETLSTALTDVNAANDTFAISTRARVILDAINDELTVAPGSTISFTGVVVELDDGETVTVGPELFEFSIDDTGVALVDEAGVVMGIAIGSTTVTLTNVASEFND